MKYWKVFQLKYFIWNFSKSLIFWAVQNWRGFQNPEFSSDGNIEEIWSDGHCNWRTSLIHRVSLSRLMNLYLSGCKRLKSLPSSICQLKSLQVLNLHGCSNLHRLPDEVRNLEASNRTLYAKGTTIREVPSSIVRLNNNLYTNFG